MAWTVLAIRDAVITKTLITEINSSKNVQIAFRFIHGKVIPDFKLHVFDTLFNQINIMFHGRNEPSVIGLKATKLARGTTKFLTSVVVIIITVPVTRTKANATFVTQSNLFTHM